MALGATVYPTAAFTAMAASNSSADRPRGWIDVPASTNKSCDYCSGRKRRCDGDGISRCSRCEKRGPGHQCIYSKRRPHKPRRIQSGEAMGWAASADLGGAAHTALPAGEGGGGVTGALLLRYGMHSFKRYRLSASPATGLVGTKENTLLSNYFGCVGFLPLASQSDIRETMVRIMTARMIPPEQRPGFGYLDVGEEKCHAIVAGCGDGAQASWNGDRGGEASSSVDDAASCIFWCAIAVGGLVQGAPVESVTRYFELAKNASERFSGPPTAERAKAWTMLGFLYGLLAQLDQFHACLQRASAFLQISAGEGSLDEVPVGLVETVRHSDTIKLFTGNMVQSEVESFCSEERPLSKISDVATDAEIYQFVMQSYRGFEQSFYGDVCADHQARAAETMEEGEAGGGDETNIDKGASSVNSSGDLMSLSGVEAVDPSGMVETMMMRLKVHSCEFEQLEDVVDRPHIRAGVGGLVINSTLVFSKAAKKDVQGVLERVSRCVEVIERYPGMCRDAMGSHIAHIMITVLSSMDAPGTRQLYDKLRAAYNPMRSVSSGPIPPFEEWQGIADICDHVYCRSLEKLTDSGEMAFSSRQSDHSHPDNQANSEYDGDVEDVPVVSLAASVNLSGGTVPRVVHDAGTPTQQQHMTSHCPPAGIAGEDPTISAVQSSDDDSLAISAGTEECFPGWPAHDAAETGQGLPQVTVASDAISTTKFGSCKAVGLDSSIESDVDVGGDGVTGYHNGENIIADGVSNTAVVFASARVEDTGAVDDDTGEDISAADWLAVTHTMLEQMGSGSGCE